MNNLFANNNVIIENDGILESITTSQMQLIGDELFEKTGVFLGVAAFKDLNGSNIHKISDEISKSLKSPYAFIIISTNDKKIDIVTDVNFDKDAVLSPYPNKGTIIPLLVSTKKGKDSFNPALLNGYADCAEKIAKVYSVKLENSFGNTNRIILDLIRLFVYGSIVLVIASRFYYKRIKKHEEK
ncbi:hypothetical protein [Campylobacter ureolyticus]|uniref:hypothetical protein n=1 Tax=Campylobacter ureolyticus TaxID=827 RepID=UPI001FD469F3|nr:hypothetical protein [Campylobacter ureolyticus]